MAILTARLNLLNGWRKSTDKNLLLLHDDADYVGKHAAPLNDSDRNLLFLRFSLYLLIKSVQTEILLSMTLTVLTWRVYVRSLLRATDQRSCSELEA